ncbi:MAG TPA: TlpA family protein disulfide reductase [Candidatus Butyricimonas faecavium]|nr:TlpA family protein disulfide reductase [Candidatus Butyricimonas faecavium]
MKFSLLFILGLFCFSELWAGPGKVVIKGAEENVCIYNSERGRGRKYFVPEKNMRETVILLPEGECEDLFYLISGDETSWIRVLPDETIMVDVRKKPWKFSGDSKAINRYLYGWTQKMFFGKPNALTYRVEMMFHQLPSREKRVPDPKIFYTKEYIEWLDNVGLEAMDDLVKANLKDDLFEEEQERRIYYSWLEMQLQNYQLAKDIVEIPAEAFVFLNEIEFKNTEFLNYPGMDDVLRIYFDMADASGLIKYDNYTFLQRRAERITNTEIRDYYILQELNNIIRNQWLYQLDKVIASVEEMVMTQDGKEKLAECKKHYQDSLKSDDNQAGKRAINISFKDVNDKEWNLYMLKGKYVLIDVWATWCGPCKYQIPHLMRLEEELKERDIVFVSLSADKSVDTQKWRDMVREFGMKGICGIAPDAFDHPFFEKYKVKSIPRFILIDPQGNIVMTKARRPSDPVLKMQLEELLNCYDQEKTTISGKINGVEDGTQIFVAHRVGMMTYPLAQTEVKDGKFELSFALNQSEFISFSSPKIFYNTIWAKPGDRIVLDGGESLSYSGGEFEFNNLLMNINSRYGKRWPSGEKVFDQKRGKLLYYIYMDIRKDIDTSILRPEMKRLLLGYFQGVLLDKMYGTIAFSKVFGKGIPRPIVKTGYSDAVLKIELLPELVHYPGWTDGVQELLYARLAAGMIKIKGQGSYVTDMALGLKDERLRETYIIDQLQMEILRGHLIGIEERIENARSMVESVENRALLSEMPEQAGKALQRYKVALPETDLSGFSFENEKGERIALADFKGKYVFIDIWSTGCNPCIGEIPYIKEMEHRFVGKPITWVSISMDLNKRVWLDFLKVKGMKGVQLICDKGFKDPFAKQIALGGIPRFLLLDKEGKIIDFQSLRPSNPVLGELLRLMLDKK